MIVKMKNAFVAFLVVAPALGAVAAGEEKGGDSDGAKLMERYNYSWNTPSKAACDSMPLGNGDLAANVYATGDAVYLLLSKSDAFDWNGNIIKTGRVKITAGGKGGKSGEKKFVQRLDIVRGCIDIELNGVTYRIWADANRAVYHVEVTSGNDIEVRVTPEFWKRKDGEQDTRHDEGDRLLWAHRNTKSVFRKHLANYGISDLAKTHADPFLNVTFGNMVESPQLKAKGGALVGSGRKFDIRIHGLRTITKDVSEFVTDMKKLAGENRTATSWDRHVAWWRAFWSRSWIVASDNTVPGEKREVCTPPSKPGTRGEPDGGFVVAQHYNIHRYMMACQSRGGCQVQFNGGLFTTPVTLDKGRTKIGEDGRLWGQRFTFQNQRLLYWPMIHAGDYDLMGPFFTYYMATQPLKKAFTKLWFKHEGSYFRENIQLSGDEIADAGMVGKPPRTRKEANYKRGWHNFHFNATLEIPYMALRLYQHTGDAKFRDTVLMPLAREGLLFYDKHYPRDEKGKIRLEPSQALETYWVAVNPTPDVAGLKGLLAGMLKIEGPGDTDRANWKRMLGELPAVPTGMRDGKRIVLPADTYSILHNAETPEMYAAFPFDVFSIVRGNHRILRDTMPYRTTPDAFGCRCWTQDQIQFAYAGLAAEARTGLEKRFRSYSLNMRFPMFGRERPDHVPDFDHNGSGSVGLQKMLINEADGKIHLLPAWPKQWDADFRLHASGGTVVRGRVKNGKLIDWRITPAARRKDVTIGKPQ